MRLGLLAKKVGMSRFYDSSGVNHPVTILKVDESNIVDIKNAEKNIINQLKVFLRRRMSLRFYFLKNSELVKLLITRSAKR